MVLKDYHLVREIRLGLTRVPGMVQPYGIGVDTCECHPWMACPQYLF